MRLDLRAPERSSAAFHFRASAKMPENAKRLAILAKKCYYEDRSVNAESLAQCCPRPFVVPRGG